MISGRALHFVFKIPELSKTAKFYRDILGMKTLRFEEFTEGCAAACNGPYGTRWNKTMIGYGSEDTHFVIELTYNFGIDSYELGNDYRGIYIKSREAIDRAKSSGWPIEKQGDYYVTEAPGGYKYFLIDEPQPVDRDPVQKVELASSNLQKSIDYWNGLLGLKIYEKTNNSVSVAFADDQAKLVLHDIGEKVNHAKAYGRIAFSCPYDQQPIIDEKIRATQNTILTPLITLDTPGKQTVRVIILADPDGHEICFVEDGGFRKLSEYDPKSDEALTKSIEKYKL